jgi:hypothetical protein
MSLELLVTISRLKSIPAEPSLGGARMSRNGEEGTMSLRTNEHLAEFIQSAESLLDTCPDLREALKLVRSARDRQPGPTRMKLIGNASATMPSGLGTDQPTMLNLVRLNGLLAQAHDLVEMTMTEPEEESANLRLVDLDDKDVVKLPVRSGWPEPVRLKLVHE